ncbi:MULTISPECIES: tetratricopeptide repeat protein [Virgibacillus]|uniref:Mitochondrial proteins import receptor n=2 Tax=Virgibacillus TaxID=84406 RepID=A0A024Q997_9BACI|nr:MULTISPECIES: hypothetical protein [Virgibacillus]EQB37433.1 hypothetical protein M948_02505 [Virgibacillus sp. CM-4]MYL40184.1 hypothetical protein [Virgibacillus massiliensis]GGJ60935.1 hypothetical protein GCM10007111_23890 [Virgibacillus kapii]CDQ39049.1 mitochondrial precursor proteins import receptor [Virgibacillus massiliensis]
MQQVTSKSSGKQNNVLPFIPEGDFYFTKGVEAFQKRKFDIAIKWMKKAIEQKPADPLYKCQLSIIYTEIGAYHAANQLLTKVLQSSEYVDCYYLMANNYAHLGLLNDAKKYADLYLEKQPEGDFKDDTLRLLDLIDIEDDEDDWEMEDEDELLIYQETVFYHMENLEWDKAIPLLEEMMYLFPEHKITKHDYTQALFFSGYQAKAIELEINELKEDPTSLYSHTNLALFYYTMDNHKEYDFHIQTLLNVYPIHEQQKLRIAVTLSRTRQHVEAYRRFVLLAKPKVAGHPSYFRWYALSAYYIGETAKAELIWQEGTKKHSNLTNELAPWEMDT